MIRTIISIVIIVAAVGSIILFAGPQYRELQDLRAENRELDEAIDKAAQLRAAREDLLTKRNSLNPQDLAKLERLVPSHIDNVRLSLDIDALATRHQLVLRDIAVSEEGGEDLTRSESPGRLGRAQITMNLVGDYGNFLSFTDDLEHSLRIIDIDSIEFSPINAQSVIDGRLQVDDNYEYAMDFTTYWLRK